jgi:hypothetical protein
VNSGSPRDGSLLGRTFAFALGHKDFEQLGAVLHPQIDFRALTTRQTWEAASGEETLRVLRLWFGPPNIVEEILAVDTDAFADRQRVAYRFKGHRPDGPFVIEQQAYFAHCDGQIDWMRLVCSGFRAPRT